MGVQCGRIVVLCDRLYIGIWCVFVMYSNVVFMEGNWVVIGVEYEGVIFLCDSLYIGIWCVFVTYSNVVFMEGNLGCYGSGVWGGGY